MTSTTRKQKFTLAEARITGAKLGIDWEEFDLKQFHLGMNAELADGAYNPNTQFATDDPIVIGKLVRTHLKDVPDYYTRWAQMEQAARSEDDAR